MGREPTSSREESTRDRPVVVVGSSNLDLVSYVPRLPGSGETLHGSSFQLGFGGKAANQAVMAARLGSPAALIAKVGTDLFGDQTIDDLRGHGVAVDQIHQAEGVSTGVATITVGADGSNTVVIVGGANDLLTDAELAAARGLIASAAIVVCQLEIPIDRTLTALRIAREEGVRTILNPAPARRQLAPELYELADVLCPNEPETELLADMEVGSRDEAIAAAHILRDRGAGAVVLTLGARGCLVVDDQGADAFPSPPVDVVDTTGAGDAFVGSLAHFLARGVDLRDAAARSCQVAAMSVSGRGTRASFPSSGELPEQLLAAPQR